MTEPRPTRRQVRELQQELAELKQRVIQEVRTVSQERDQAKVEFAKAQQIVSGIDPILRTVSDCQAIFSQFIGNSAYNTNEWNRRQALEILAHVLGIPLVLSASPPDQITAADGTVYERRTY